MSHGSSEAFIRACELRIVKYIDSFIAGLHERADPSSPVIKEA